jgi:hypothetical protein
MTRLRWWLRIIGAFYLLQFIMIVFVRAPIRAQGPPNVLLRAEAAEPDARFVIDTWTTFGLEVGAIGLGLLLASRKPSTALALVSTVIAIDFCRGIVADVYLLTRGEPFAVLGPWFIIHTAVIISGLWVLRTAREAATGGAASGAPA